MKISRFSASLLILLLIGAAFAIFTDQSGQLKDDHRIGSTLVPSDQLGLLQSIEISGVDGKIKLEKLESGQWVIQGDASFPADAQKIVEFSDKLSSIKVSRLVSRKSERWQSLKIEERNYVLLELKDQKPIKIYLGKNNSAGGQYMSFESSKPVSYTIDPRLAAFTNAGQWELKTILHLAPDQVKKIEIQKVGSIEPLVFTSASEGAEIRLENLKDQEKMKANEIDKLLGGFANLSYSERFAEGKLKDLTEIATVRLSSHTGELYQLQVFSRKENTKNKKAKNKLEHYIRISLVASNNEVSQAEFETYLAPWLFKVDAYRVENLSRNRQEFVTKNSNSKKKG